MNEKLLNPSARSDAPFRNLVTAKQHADLRAAAEEAKRKADYEAGRVNFCAPCKFEKPSPVEQVDNKVQSMAWEQRSTPHKFTKAMMEVPYHPFHEDD